MENQNTSNESVWKNIEKSHRRGKIMGGLLVIAAGSLFLARELGAEIPFWIFTWKMLLIGIGVVLAIKHKFMHPGWIILVGIGGVFLLNDLYPEMQIKPFLWPVLLIVIGLFILFKPRNKLHNKYHEHWKNRFDNRYEKYRSEWQTNQHASDFASKVERTEDDYLSSTNIMGGTQKKVISKKFKGGEIVNVFGGAHIDLTQADLEGTATLDITQIFGGTKLLIPANWEVKSETVTVCGGIEDKRSITNALNEEPKKILILVGTAIFGGLEIKSF